MNNYKLLGKYSSLQYHYFKKLTYADSLSGNRQFNIQQFYILPTQLYLCVLCGSENKQPLFPYTALTDWFV
jgi:hypothetical protein